jgi:hypothetical protein
MKKLVIAISIALVAIVTASYKEARSISKHSKAKVEPPALIYSTLNGMDAIKAAGLMQNFENMRNYDYRPTMTNVWFDSKTVQLIDNLLVNEGADGIRVYVVNDMSTNTPPFKNSILLVSTKTCTYDPTKHTDYYEHSSADPLFNSTTPITGEVHHDNCNGGAVLYTICGGQCPGNTSCVPGNMHYISRTTGEQMVKLYGNHSINIVSEWYDRGLFDAFAADGNYSGIRIYFSTRVNNGSKYSGKDSFVITTTVLGSDGKTQVDDFTCKTNNPFFNGFKKKNKSGKIGKFTTSGQDNGELCPDNCNAP